MSLHEFPSLVIKYTINSNVLCIFEEKKILNTSNGGGANDSLAPWLSGFGGGHGPLPPPLGTPLLNILHRQCHSSLQLFYMKLSASSFFNQKYYSMLEIINKIHMSCFKLFYITMSQSLLNIYGRIQIIKFIYIFRVIFFGYLPFVCYKEISYACMQLGYRKITPGGKFPNWLSGITRYRFESTSQKRKIKILLNEKM